MLDGVRCHQRRADEALFRRDRRRDDRVGVDPAVVEPSPELELEFKEQSKTFDPDDVYGDAPNPTQL